MGRIRNSKALDRRANPCVARRMAFGFRAKLILLVGLAVLLVGAFSLAYNYIVLRGQILSSTKRTVEVMAATAALQLRGEDVRELRAADDYKSPEYAAVYRALKGVLVQNAGKNFKVDNIYVIRQDPDDPTGERIYFAAHLPGDDAFEFGVAPVSRMADPDVNYIGNDVSYPLRPEMRRIVYEGASATSTGIYEFPPYGAWISGFAPVRTAAGEVEGILEIDYDLNFIESYLFEQFLRVFLGIAGILLLAIIGSVWLANTFSRPVQALTRAVVAIGEGDYKHRLRLNRTDEFEALGRHFNDMARALEERMHLSKYVSRDTLNRVAAVEDSHAVLSGTRETIVCLFSDIRGFTAYSERHPVENVIRLLNDLLHRQTQVILAHDGNIDKFVGDEVMATFRGEHRLRNALNAAMDIQRELQATATDGSREAVSIGIGINEGVVIQGDIGSEARKDFTVIGSAVNLAARLCSAAGGGQILVTEALAKRIEAPYAARFEREVQFKGIEGASAVYAIRPGARS